jgi:hypothetical protein
VPFRRPICCDLVRDLDGDTNAGALYPAQIFKVSVERPIAI